MTSTITAYSTSINVSFPIQGQDNDTQGFRDNYLYIQEAFASAANEVTDLQNNQTIFLNTQTEIINELSNISTLISGNIQNGSVSTEIIGNSITILNTSSLYVVYSTNPTDSLSTINSGTNGQIIYLRSQSDNEIFSVTTSGNIASSGTITSAKYSPFIYDTSVWYPVGSI